MSSEIKFQAECPNCGKSILMSAALEPTDYAADVRAGIKPASLAYIYQISSDQIEKFVQIKAQQFVPGIKVVATPITPKETKNGLGRERRRYAFMKIAFSDDALADNNKSTNWYEKIGESGSRLVPELFNKVVMKYKFDRDKVSKWLKNYQILEYLEKFFGISTEMLEVIKDGTTPRQIKANDGSIWIYFSAAPESIIMDMLSEVGKEGPAGKVEIMDTTVIAKGQISYTVYLYPNELPVKEDAHVRQILMGNNK